MNIYAGALDHRETARSCPARSNRRRMVVAGISAIGDALVIGESIPRCIAYILARFSSERCQIISGCALSADNLVDQTPRHSNSEQREFQRTLQSRNRDQPCASLLLSPPTRHAAAGGHRNNCGHSKLWVRVDSLPLDLLPSAERPAVKVLECQHSAANPTISERCTTQRKHSHSQARRRTAVRRAGDGVGNAQLNLLRSGWV